MRIACLSFTKRGALLGESLLEVKSPNYSFHHFSNSSLEGGIKAFLNENWSLYGGFVFISATGIAVRMIFPYIESKTIDPAVLVIDDNGKFVISLLSGHIGGANELTNFIAGEIKGIPVITTASDAREIDSVDIFAKHNNYFIEDIDSVSKITAFMLDNRKLGLFSEDNKKIKYDNIEYITSLESIGKDIEAIIIVSSKNDIDRIPILNTVLRPRVINIGIGARKDIETSIVVEAIGYALLEKGLSQNSIKSIGTVDVKADEKGIIEAAEFFKVPLEIFTRERIKEVQDRFEKSEFVLKTIGVSSVSEPCAFILGGEMILNKYKYNGVTVSLAVL